MSFCSLVIDFSFFLRYDVIRLDRGEIMNTELKLDKDLYQSMERALHLEGKKQTMIYQNQNQDEIEKIEGQINEFVEQVEDRKRQLDTYRLAASHLVDQKEKNR